MNKIIVCLALVIVIFLGFVSFNARPESKIYGSIIEGQAYNSTTTDSTWNAAALISGGSKVLKVGPGTFGSVIITNSTAGSFNVYDATTTVNGGIYGTTTLARIPASLAAGTYTFDSSFGRGLLIEFQSSNVASGTITSR